MAVEKEVGKDGAEERVVLPRHQEPATPASAEMTAGLKIVSYALNNHGEYELTPEFVWQPVSVVNQQAWQEIEKKIDCSRQRVAAGRVSCLHYYMTAHQIDVTLVAQYTGQPRWKVLLHLVPFVYARLSSRSLAKYARLYKISVDELRHGRLLPPVYNLKPEQPRA